MKKRSIFILSTVLIIILMVIIFFAGGKKGEGDKFKLIELKKGNVENLVSSTGTLSALETVEVGSQVSGIINRLYVDYNSIIKKGQLLAALDKTLFEVAVSDRRSALNRSEAIKKRSDAEVKRNEPLFKKGHLSEAEFLVITTESEKAKAELEMAEGALKKAKTNLKYCEIRSPINGTVIERTVDVGETIAANFQSPKLFVIAEDLTNMQIEVNVDESDIGQIKKGQDVRFTVQTYSERVFKGVVRQIRLQPRTLQNVVNYTVIVEASNKNRLLLPGMTATVDFVIENISNVLLVPNRALGFSPSAEELRRFSGKTNGKIGRSGKDFKTDFGSTGKGFPGRPEFQRIPEDAGRVFYLDNKNNFKVSVIKKGVTDGINTEIKGIIRGELFEGFRVIIGIEKLKKQRSKKGSKNTLLPSPPGR
ncbi:MAG: efflux RND transporter periplasmic adaptor subunit [Acidobacteriota bacterium]